MVNFEQFKKSGVSAIYHRVPIEYLAEFRKVMAHQGKYFKIRYRGPRNKGIDTRSKFNRQSSCLKSNATTWGSFFTKLVV